MFKSNSLRKSALVVMMLLAVTAPMLVSAATGILVEPPPSSDSSLASPEGVQGFLNDMLTWLSRIFWIVAVFFIIYAGFTYLTSAGDPEKVTTATHMLKYAAIGIAVALLATVLPTLIDNLLY